MDFSHLPEMAILKIFEYLSLEDCIRVRGVDRIFCGIAHLTISHTNYLDLTEDRFRNLTGDQLTVILDLCSSNLERIKFPSRDDVPFPILDETEIDWSAFYEQLSNMDDHGKELTNIYARYNCPRLTSIDLGCLQISDVVFEQLIRNNPNMEYLVWNVVEFPGFPDITINTLKTLGLFVHTEASLQTLIGRCPNLKDLNLVSTNVDIPAHMWDQFFASIPQAKRIFMRMLGSYTQNFLRFEELVNFWNLPLTSLHINFPRDDDNPDPGDSLLFKVATSFPHLQELKLGTLAPTSGGITSLAALKELKTLELNLVPDENGHDEGIRQLAHCRNLQSLVLRASFMTGGTFLNLLRSCSQLERMEIWEIIQVDSPEEAVVILESLAGMAPKDITIKFNSNNKAFLKSVWEAELTKAAIKKLEENDGLDIKFEWREW